MGRRVEGVICDRRVPARVKGKVCRMVARPDLLYGLETMALLKGQEAELKRGGKVKDVQICVGRKKGWAGLGTSV